MIVCIFVCLYVCTYNIVCLLTSLRYKIIQYTIILVLARTKKTKIGTPESVYK